MGYAEFPHAHYLEYDEHQIILLVKKLESEYAEILDKARKAESDAASAVSKVDSYMTTIDARINQQVSSSVEQATRLLKNDFQNLNNKFNDLTNNFGSLRGEVQAAQREIKSLANQLYNDLQEFKSEIRSEIRGQLDRNTTTVNNKVNELDRLTATRMHELSEQIVIAMNMVEKNSILYTDVELTKFGEDIQSVVEESLDDIKNTVEDIKNSNIYNNVGWLWNNLCSIGGFTAMEIFEYGEFNVDMWNQSGITCQEWFTSGKQMLGYNTGRMFDRLSGRFTEVGTVVQELVNLLNAQGIIRNGFDALSIKQRKEKKHDEWKDT